MKKLKPVESVKVLISELKLLELIKSTNGKMFSVTFTKKDGSIRKLNGRLGVKKYLKGGVNTTAHMSNYINVFDAHKREYRKVNLDTVESLVINSKEYIVYNCNS
jgi:hypothetical protein